MGWPDGNEVIGMNLEGRHCRTAAVVVEVEGVDCYYVAAAVEEARSRLGLLERAAEEAAAAGRIAEPGESRVMLEVDKFALGIVSVRHESQQRVKQYTRWGICWVTRRCCHPSN